MDTWEERYLKLAAQYDKVVTENTKLKEAPPPTNKIVENQQKAIEAWRQRTLELGTELKDVYQKSFTLKVESFIRTIWAWTRSGFKINRDLGDKRFAICASCPHLKNDRCTVVIVTGKHSTFKVNDF